MHERRGFLKTLMAFPFAAKAAGAGGGAVSIKSSSLKWSFAGSLAEHGWDPTLQPMTAWHYAVIGETCSFDRIRGVATNIPTLPDDIAWLDREVCDQAIDLTTLPAPAEGESEPECPVTTTVVTIVSPSTVLSTPSATS